MRSWDDIPTEQWVSDSVHFVPGAPETGEPWTVEFDYVGANNVTYHHPPDDLEFDDFADLYDELQEAEIVFYIETTPGGSEG